MKPTKIFFLLILVLTGGIIFLDWIRHYYFPIQIISPVARIKTIFIIISGIIIMRLTFTSRGFNLFLILYLGLWLIYWALNFIAVHNIYSGKLNEAFAFYKDVMPLLSPLPFIFFWFVDRLFFYEEKSSS
jgi:hypothetical protein